jgi:hypothetical protein
MEAIFAGWIRFFHGTGDSADQASAADWDHDGFDVGMLFEDFETERPLAGDDGVVVEGVNQRKSFGAALLDGLGVGFVVVRAVQENICSVRARGRYLGERGGERHDDARVDSVAAGVVGDSLGMVSGGGGDHSARAFIGSEREKFVQSAALFECAGALLIVELEENGIIGECGEGF